MTHDAEIDDAKPEDFRLKQIRYFLDSSSFIPDYKFSEEARIEILSLITNVLKKATDDLAHPIPRKIIETYSEEMDALILDCFFNYNHPDSIIFDKEVQTRLESIAECVYESLRGYEDKETVKRVLSSNYGKRLISENLAVKHDEKKWKDHDGLTLIFRRASFDIERGTLTSPEQAIRKHDSLDDKISSYKSQKELRKVMVEVLNDVLGANISALFEESLKYGKKDISSGLQDFSISLFYAENPEQLMMKVQNLLQESVNSRVFPDQAISLIEVFGKAMDHSIFGEHGFKKINGQEVVQIYENLPGKKYFESVLYSLHYLDPESKEYFIQRMKDSEVQRLITLVNEKLEKDRDSDYENYGRIIAKAFKTALESEKKEPENFNKYLKKLNDLFSNLGLENEEDALNSIKFTYLFESFSPKLSRYAENIIDHYDFSFGSKQFFEDIEYLDAHENSEIYLEKADKIVQKMKINKEEKSFAVITIAKTLCRCSELIGRENFDRMLELYSDNCSMYKSWKDFPKNLETTAQNLAEIDNKEAIISRISQTYTRLMRCQ